MSNIEQPHLDRRTAEFKVKPRVKDISGKNLRLSDEDREQFRNQGKISPEHIRSYLNPDTNESVELFKISATDAPLIAFLNTDEKKVDILNHYTSTAGPFTYSELALRFSTNKEIDKLSALSQEIQNRQLDADDLLFYCPKDELENLGLKPPVKKEVQL